VSSTVATRPRIGFVGVGWIGRNRMEAIEASGAGRVAAIADPALPESLHSFEELLELDLDGIAIATPSALHAEQAIAALDRGFAVFCQKPLGRTAPEARAVVEAARRADRLLAVDLSYRHTAAARAVRDEIAAGNVGRVLAARLAFHNAYGPDKKWFYERALAGGGCLVDLGVHLVDLALWALDFPDWRVRTAHIVTPAGKDVEELALAELGVGSAVVSVACSWHLHAGCDAAIEAEFYGTDGGVALRNVDGSYYDLRADRYRGTTRETLAEPPDGWGGRAAVEWAGRLGAGERFDPEIERVVTVAEVLDAIYEEASCASS
jgi:predicted dehydrogenase